MYICKMCECRRWTEIWCILSLSKACTGLVWRLPLKSKQLSTVFLEGNTRQVSSPTSVIGQLLRRFQSPPWATSCVTFGYLNCRCHSESLPGFLKVWDVTNRWIRCVEKMHCKLIVMWVMEVIGSMELCRV